MKNVAMLTIQGVSVAATKHEDGTVSIDVKSLNPVKEILLNNRKLTDEIHSYGSGTWGHSSQYGGGGSIGASGGSGGGTSCGAGNIDQIVYAGGCSGASGGGNSGPHVSGNSHLISQPVEPHRRIHGSEDDS